MRPLILILAAALATPSLAQPAPGPPAPPPPTKLFAARADIDALVAQSKAERAAGNAAGGGKSVIALAPYNASLEYRTTVTAAAVHEKEAELFYVLDGSGVLTTGGKLTAETRVNAENLSGTGITGGKTQAVAKGDIFIVPENTPHWFGAINGALVMLSLHVPRPVGAH